MKHDIYVPEEMAATCQYAGRFFARMEYDNAMEEENPTAKPWTRGTFEGELMPVERGHELYEACEQIMDDAASEEWDRLWATGSTRSLVLNLAAIIESITENDDIDALRQENPEVDELLYDATAAVAVAREELPVPDAKDVLIADLMEALGQSSSALIQCRIVLPTDTALEQSLVEDCKAAVLSARAAIEKVRKAV